MLRESERTLEERYHRWLEFIGEPHSEDKQKGFLLAIVRVVLQQVNEL